MGHVDGHGMQEEWTYNSQDSAREARKSRSKSAKKKDNSSESEGKKLKPKEKSPAKEGEASKPEKSPEDGGLAILP